MSWPDTLRGWTYVGAAVGCVVLACWAWWLGRRWRWRTA